MHADRAAGPARNLVFNVPRGDRQVAHDAGLAAAAPGAGLAIHREERATAETGLDGIQEWVIRRRRRAEPGTAARHWRACCFQDRQTRQTKRRGSSQQRLDRGHDRAEAHETPLASVSNRTGAEDHPDARRNSSSRVD
jgi:hypothetical protein